MKGKLHKSMNYGWMVQHEHCGIDNISFYPLHPYDTITNKIETFEGKEVDFVLEDFWETGLEEKLIKVAIISANITDVHFKQKTLYTEEQMEQKLRKAIDMARESMFEFNEKIPTSDEIIQSLKQPKKD